MIYQINHSFKPKIFVPYVAIRNNIGYLTNKEELVEVQLSDGKIYNSKVVKIINVLSDEAKEIISELYKCEVIQVLNKWYKFDYHMNSLDFILIELKETND